MSIYKNTPFIYVIGWTDLNIWYLGCRFAAGCHPQDIWTTYFTSSKLVKEIREDFGEPDHVEILRTGTKSEIPELEREIILEFDLPNDARWLNKGAWKSTIATPEIRAKLREKNRSRHRIYDYQGQRYCVKELAELSGLHVDTIKNRLRHGFSVQEAVELKSTDLVKSAAQAKAGDPAIKAAISKKAFETWSDPIVRERRTSAIRKALSDPTVQQNRIKGCRLSWTPERSAKHAKECQDRCAKSSKKYDCGSGKMLSVKEMAEIAGVSKSTIQWRIRNGVEPIDCLRPRHGKPQ